jgi:hemoglobin
MTENTLTETVATTPFERLGGAPGVRRIADAFYDVMERERKYAALRAMHAGDLSEMRESLAGFLAVWLGGPRDWIASHPGFCLMSRHRDMAVTTKTSTQWMDAMCEALAQAGVEPEMAGKIERALRPVAEAMVRR